MLGYLPQQNKPILAVDNFFLVLNLLTCLETSSNYIFT